MDDAFDLALCGGSALTYDAVVASGPPAHPLQFPTPSADWSVIESADVVDHRTGAAFRATSVLMRRPVHARGCAARAVPAANASACSSFDSTRSRPRHQRTMTPPGTHIRGWHSAFNAPSSSLAGDSPKKSARQHRRTNSHSSDGSKTLPPCDAACDVPDRAYMVRRKICNTAHGSVRLCVVLRRVDSNTASYARAVSPDSNGFDSLVPRRDRDMERVPVPEWETTDELVAIKVVNWSKLSSLRGRHMEDPVKELAALQQLLGNYHRCHPNIVPVLDSLQDETHLFTVFPYISGGDLCGRLLDKMISSPTGRVDEDLARTWFRQILSAIGHLQKKGVCHRDLSLENLLVDEQNNVRLIDFGLCLRVPYADPTNRHLVTDASANTNRRLMKAQGQCGKLGYMAPEVAAQCESFDGFAIDLWAAGIVLFELLVGKKPFALPNPTDKNFCIVALDGDLAGLLKAKDIDLDEEVVDLLQRMLFCDPAKRMTLAEIAEHPWVQGGASRSETPMEQEGMTCGWFIRNTSIDDLDGAKAPRAFLVDDYSCSRSSTAVESMTSTIESVPSIVGVRTSLPLSHHSQPSSEFITEVEQDADAATGRVSPRKKRQWLAFRLKPTKWRRPDKCGILS